MSAIVRPAEIFAAQAPLIRQSNLVRKHDDITSEPVSAPPRKRAKVTFHNTVEVKDLQEWAKSPELIQEEVRRALQLHATGDDTGFDEIMDVYAPGEKEGTEPTPDALKNYTAALLSNVAAIDKSCSNLVYAILKSNWVYQADDYVALYVRFLANLLSTQGKFIQDVLDMMAQILATAKPWKTNSDGARGIAPSQVRSRIHSALAYFLRLIPSSSHTLSSILSNNFPHQDDSKRAHIIYVHSLLKIISYAPELRGDLLALIADRLVKIDVQVQVDIEDLADDAGERLVQDLPRIRSNLGDDIDDLDYSDNESDVSSESDDEDEENQRTKDIVRNVEKMDGLLELLFRFYDQDFSANSITTRRSALDTLLSQFVTIVLPTHRSRHTQFLLFHFAQTSPEFVDTFVGTCVAMAFDKGQSSVGRQAAAAYLASFVARGSQVPAIIVRDVFDYIGAELNRLRKQYEPSCRGPDLRRYSSYYCLVQALLYIFCFRWRDLEYNAEDESEDEGYTPYDDQHRWRPGVKETLALNVFSTRLNPLKICSPAIVMEFAKIANHLGVIYVYGLLETNKRIHLSQFSNAYGHLGRETALSARKDESQYHLDEYFPFDPYRLPRSKKWVEGDYREWSGIPGLDDVQVDDSASEEEAASEGDLNEETATEATKDSP